MHLTQDSARESTLKTKNAFERDCHVRGVEPRSYHTDNGRYAEPTFQEDCENKIQGLAFCGVDTHHLNGILEVKIKDPALVERIMLLCAQHQ